MPKMIQKTGLTHYSMACGYRQMVEVKTEKKNVQVWLEWDSACYAIRAHDYIEHTRLDWICEESLTDARDQWTRLVNQYVGTELVEIRKDKRYTFDREFTGAPQLEYVARFCGERVGCTSTKYGAEILAYNHKHAEK